MIRVTTFTSIQRDADNYLALETKSNANIVLPVEEAVNVRTYKSKQEHSICQQW